MPEPSIRIKVFKGIDNLSDNITLNPFSEPRFDDEDAGYYFDVQLKQPFKYDTCQIPFDSTITNTGTSNLVTIVDQNGNTITTLKGGETYQVLVVSTIDGGSSSTVYTNQIVQA